MLPLFNDEVISHNLSDKHNDYKLLKCSNINKVEI